MEKEQEIECPYCKNTGQIEIVRAHQSGGQIIDSEIMECVCMIKNEEE